MKTSKIKLDIIAILDDYEAKVGESKKVIILCSQHHVELMKETWPRSMFRGKPIATVKKGCLVCKGIAINLVKKEETSETSSATN